MNKIECNLNKIECNLNKGVALDDLPVGTIFSVDGGTFH